MTIDYICDTAEHIRRKYDDDNPCRLISAMQILLLREPMGTAATACKGFYLCQSKIRVITVNSDLSEENQHVVLAHELGHAVLHDKIGGIKTFHDFALFDETSRYEYEANIFAAELLMPDSDVLELLNDDISFFGAAQRLCVPPELLDFKFRILKRKGYKVIDPPLGARSDFLRKLGAEYG